MFNRAFTRKGLGLSFWEFPVRSRGVRVEPLAWHRWPIFGVKIDAPAGDAGAQLFGVSGVGVYAGIRHVLLLLSLIANDNDRFNTTIEFCGEDVIRLCDVLQRETMRDDLVGLEISGFDVL